MNKTAGVVWSVVLIVEFIAMIYSGPIYDVLHPNAVHYVCGELR